MKLEIAMKYNRRIFPLYNESHSDEWLSLLIIATSTIFYLLLSIAGPMISWHLFFSVRAN